MSLSTITISAISILLLLIIFLSIYSTSFQIFLVNRIAQCKGYQLHASVPYGELPEQQLDIYQPQEKSNRLLPVVVFFYGGCWGACSTLTKEHYAFVAESFSSNKVIAVVADYRLYPNVNFPDMIDDAARAVEWAHLNVARFGGDPQHIFLMGHSAGAHMAAMLAVNSQHLSQQTYKDIKGFIGLAGPYNFLPFDEDYMPTLFGSPMQVSDSQPIHFVDGTEPPSLLLYGGNDTRVKLKNIEGMTEKILAMGGEVDKHIYSDLDHASILASFSIIFRDKKPIFTDTLNFIHKHSQ